MISISFGRRAYQGVFKASGVQNKHHILIFVVSSQRAEVTIPCPTELHP